MLLVHCLFLIFAFVWGAIKISMANAPKWAAIPVCLTIWIGLYIGMWIIGDTKNLKILQVILGIIFWVVMFTIIDIALRKLNKKNQGKNQST